MSNSKFTGYAWHIEKVKGTNRKRKSCFNCVYYCEDDHSCNTKQIPITNNNARYCSSYENDYKDDDRKNPIKPRKYIATPDEIKQTEEDLNRNKEIVQERDIIDIKNIKTGKVYKVKILYCATGDEKHITEICINQKVGYCFEYKNFKFEIVELYKNAVSIKERISRLINGTKSKLVISNPRKKHSKIENKKIIKPIVEENDILHFKTQSCKKGSQYSEETLKIKKGEKEYKDLIKRCIGKEVGYRCKYRNLMYKLIYIEKSKIKNIVK